MLALHREAVEPPEVMHSFSFLIYWINITMRKETNQCATRVTGMVVLRHTQGLKQNKS